MAGRFPYGLLSLDDPMTQRKPLMGLLSQGQGMQRQPLPGNGMSIDTIMPGPGGSMSAFAPQNASAGSLLNMIPDAPAPDAANAGPAPMPAQPQQQPGAPMQLHSQDAAPPQWSQQNDAVQSGMVGSEAEPQGGILGGFGKALGALSNVYGGGGPGDGLINLGIAVGSPGNLLQNVARANEMTARSNQQQQKTQALNQTARLASEKLGISYEQALGALQSGGGSALLSQIFRAPEKPQLVTTRNADGSESQTWMRPGQSTGVLAGVSAAENKSPTVQRVKQPDGSEVAVQWDRATSKWVPLDAPQGGNAVQATLPKLTEQQSKDVGFWQRGIEANKGLTADAEKALTSVSDVGLENAPGVLGVRPGRMLQNPEFQTAHNAARNFLAVVLRKDTGAAITSQEWGEYTPLFIPQPGDAPGLVEQKRKNREVALQAIKDGLGNVGDVLDRVMANRQGASAGEQKPAAPVQPFDRPSWRRM